MKIRIRPLFYALSTVLVVLLAACSKKGDATDDSSSQSSSSSQELLEAQLAEIKSLYPNAQITDSGLCYIVSQEGNGDATPHVGNMVTAHYAGTLLDGKPFDSSYERGRPFSFAVGAGRVIPGWDEAFLAMKKGEKRTLILPSKLGYGKRDMGVIPPDSILVFEVELLDFK